MIRDLFLNGFTNRIAKGFIKLTADFAFKILAIDRILALTFGEVMNVLIIRRPASADF